MAWAVRKWQLDSIGLSLTSPAWRALVWAASSTGHGSKDVAESRTGTSLLVGCDGAQFLMGRRK